MVETPPDILVTNYSMLNAMLMREFEEPVFAKTRAWLDEDPEHVFTLIVDELHLYRGTQGSEVAMVVRSLLRRLGWMADLLNFGIIATSASLTDAPAGLTYLEQFFGVDRDSFAVVPGVPSLPETHLPLSRQRVVDSAEDRCSPPCERLASLHGVSLTDALAAACATGPGNFRATRLSVIANRLFDEPDPGLEATKLIPGGCGLELPSTESVSLRAHMFARTMRGIWACSDPACDRVDATFQFEGRTIGACTASRAIPARVVGWVLELLYCFECGDISLGGYVAGSLEGEGFLLSSTPAEIPFADAAPVFRRTTGQYLLSTR